METLYPTGKEIHLNTTPLFQVSDGAYAVGYATVKLKVRRASDNKVLDWGAPGGPKFEDAAGPFVRLLEPMIEFGAAFEGEYYYVLDLTTIQNPTSYDTYYITVIEDDTVEKIANLPQVGQVRIDAALDDATLSRKALYNDQTLQPGDTNNLVLKDDDKVTDLAKWNVKDPGSMSVVVRPGAPAIRERTL